MVRFLQLSILSVLAVVVLGVPAVHAQSGRLEDELALTDRRIELAEAVVQNSEDPAPRRELGLAVDLQQRARAAAASSQALVALRLTRDARAHADRATSMVRGLPDPDRVVAQVERTRELLDRAREQVESCTDPRARNLLRVSSEMQTRAESALRESRYVAALQLTLSAQERLFRALRACRIVESAEQGASRALSRTDEVLSRARTSMEGDVSEAAAQALARATTVQGDAYAEYRGGHFDASIRLTQAARALAHRALRLSGAGSRGR